MVAYQQDLHFRQVFKVLEKMGYAWAREQMVHVAFGMVSYEGRAHVHPGRHTVYLDELLERAQEKALAIIEEKSPGLDGQGRQSARRWASARWSLPRCSTPASRTSTSGGTAR